MSSGLGLAALLSGPIRGSTFFRAVIFFPYIISYVIVALMWKSILDPYTGILNSALVALGLPPQNWLGDIDTALPTLMGITVWKDAGYAMLIYLAALQSIPTTFYEAASIDGATPMQQFRYLTLPLLMPTTLFVVVISMITHFRSWLPLISSPMADRPMQPNSSASSSSRKPFSSSISAMLRPCPS